MCLKNVIHPIDFTRVSSTRRALPNCAPSHSQPLSPTPSHSQPLPATLSHSHQLTNSGSTETTHSHPFFNKFDPLGPTPTYFSRKTTHSHHSHLFSRRSSTKGTCIHHFSNYNRISLPVTINVLKELSLENIIFEYWTSEKKRKAYFSKNQIYPSILLCMKYGRQCITYQQKIHVLKNALKVLYGIPLQTQFIKIVLNGK